MSIETSCKKCRKTYHVPDKYAGKKFKCKKCGAVIEVFDDLDVIEEDDFGYGDDYEDDYGPPPKKAKSKPSRKKKKKRRNVDSMPWGVRMSCVGLVLLLVMSALSCLGGLIQLTQNRPQAPVTLVIVFARIVIQIGVFIGILQRQKFVRVTAMIMSSIMIAILIVVMIGFKEIPLRQDPAMANFLNIYFSAQILSELLIVTGLLIPPAEDYLNQ